MQLYDGSTTLSGLNPWDAITFEAVADTQLEENNGDIIAAGNPDGRAPQKFCRFALRRTTSELASWRTFATTGETTAWQFTDPSGRVWDARLMAPPSWGSSEPTHTVDGHFLVDVDLLLTGINDDTGRTAWSNVDAGFGGITSTKAGSSALYLPVGYADGAGAQDVAAARHELTPGFLAVDPARRTARKDRVLRWADSLDYLFVPVLLDYFCTDLRGAEYPFSYTDPHYGTVSYRWLGAFRCELTAGLRGSLTMQLREEV